MWANNGGKNKKKESWWVNGKGYIEGRVWIDADTQVRVKKHRWIMENHLGRKLKADEDVHHINGDKQDNRVENLMVVSHSEHASITNYERDYSNHKPKEFSKDERKARSERAKRLHKEGTMMTPQARAAPAKARGESE